MKRQQRQNRAIEIEGDRRRLVKSSRCLQLISLASNISLLVIREGKREKSELLLYFSLKLSAN